MAPNYPDLPDSPDLSESKSKTKKSSSKPDSSPLSKPEALVEIEDFDKYEVRRAANGTGILSSLFTLSTLIFINEIRFFLYYRDLLSWNPFQNFLFTAGFAISFAHLVVIGCSLFFPSFLLQGNKMAKLSPLLVTVILQLFMLHFHESDSDLKVFVIQGWYGKYLMVKEFLMTYGTFFGTCILFFCLNSAYNTPVNKVIRPFEFIDYPEEEKESSPV